MMCPVLLQFKLNKENAVYERKTRMHWNGQPANKEGIHLQNKNIQGGKDHLSTISMVIIKEERFFTVSRIKIKKLCC